MTSGLVQTTDVIELVTRKEDYIRRFSVVSAGNKPLQISAEVRTAGVTGVPGSDCSVFFNIEYAEGPVFWDTFLYPDTGTTPWRTLSCDVRARGEVRAIEMHIRFRLPGQLAVRNVRIAEIDPWPEDADVVVAVFGDSTDMTCYLATEQRLTRRLELLLRDRFFENRIDVHGLAEGGEYLQRLIESGRLKRELQALPRCDVALLRYGLNDADKRIDPAAFGTQLHTACDSILKRFPNAQIVLSTTIPAQAQAFDQQILTVATARKLPVLRLDTLLRERSATGEWDWHHQARGRIGRHRSQNPPDNPTGLAGDKHPNAYGAQLIAEYYFEQLEPIVAGLLEQRAKDSQSL